MRSKEVQIFNSESSLSVAFPPQRADMKLLFVLLHLSCLSSAPVYARVAPSFFPVFGPESPSGNPPIAPSPATIALPPSGMQLKTVDQSHHLNRHLFLAIVIMSIFVGLITLASFSILIYLWSKLQQSNPRSIEDSDAGPGLEPVLVRSGNLKMNFKVGIAMIEYAVIDAATNSFSHKNVLGEGGFGRVYKAHFSNNFVAAVKRLDSGREDLVKEFDNEVQIMNQVQHPNIVPLLGYCLHGQARILVYELMANGSLEKQLHGRSRGSTLSWHMRMKIALDAARGLEYLHDHCNPPVIHRDLKSANILLDSSFNAKLSDFGLAITGDQNKCNIKLSGTVGYVAPEYLIDGKLTEKSDVYAFGVVLLELLMGKKPVEELAPSQCQSIVSWAMPRLTDRSKLPDMIDPVIRNTMDLKHLYQVAAVAILCVQPEPSYRPLITDVLHSLIPLVPSELGGTLRVAKDAGN